MNEEKLTTITQTLPNIKRGKSTYYSLDGYNSLLKQLALRITEIEDLIILPFYITDKITYEIYDYELRVRVTKEPKGDEYILKKTGKKRIEDIDDHILEKYRHCYFEIPPDETIFIKVLRDYYEYLKNDDIRKRIEEHFGPFLLTNIYFELY